MQMITVATFNEREDAEALQSKLESAGIKTCVQDLQPLQRLLFAGDHLARITVEVTRKDFDKAREMLKMWDGPTGPLKEAIHCPQCGSTRVEYPQYGRKFVTPAFHLSLAIAFGIIKKEFYCEDCQYTWPREEKIDVPRDPLGWPVRPRT